jgi:hypothetical protein
MKCQGRRYLSQRLGLVLWFSKEHRLKSMPLKASLWWHRLQSVDFE